MLYGYRYRALRRLLREIRKEAALSQTQLAEKLGKGQSYVSKIERGEQFIDVVEFIGWCEACNTKSSQQILKIENAQSAGPVNIFKNKN